MATGNVSMLKVFFNVIIFFSMLFFFSSTHTTAPHNISPQWYIVLGTYALAPLLAIINAYTAGLTDVNMANLYNKLGIFLFAMAGGSEGGITTGLAMSGVIMASVTASCEIMQVRHGWCCVLLFQRTICLHLQSALAVFDYVPSNTHTHTRTFDLGT